MSFCRESRARHPALGMIHQCSGGSNLVPSLAPVWVGRKATESEGHGAEDLEVELEGNTSMEDDVDDDIGVNIVLLLLV